MCPQDPHAPSGAAARPSSRPRDGLRDGLRDALLVAATEARASTEALRDAVCDYVEDGRRRGIPLDEMTAAVKLLVARLRQAGAIPMPPDGTDALVEQLVAWCAEIGSNDCGNAL